MHQIKLFEGSEDAMRALENEINEWLRTSGAKVVQVFGNIAPQSVLPSSESRAGLAADGGIRRFAPSDILVCVLYEV
ncbi:MAG: hypothetical protein SFY69_11140 [Planctomycetota bacterium]|nr:hypothetical protein [Planctomycetota bacterium]